MDWKCPESGRIDALEKRVSVLDGNGSDMAEGGVIGRMKRQHDENRKTLSRIEWLAVTTLVAMLANVVIKLIGMR